MEKDIAEAIEWYLGISTIVATGFIEELNGSFNLLKLSPEAFPIVHLDLRMYVLKRYPYKLIYIIADKEIVVQAVVHHKIKPKKWQQEDR